MFINRYTITNYETTKHGSRAGQTDQQSGEASEEISVKAEGNRMYERRVRDIATTGVSLCAGGRKVIEDVTSSRGERSGDCKIACKYNQRSSAIEQEDKRKYQRDYNRSDKDLFKTKWDVKKIKDRWSSSMNLIG